MGALTGIIAGAAAVVGVVAAVRYAERKIGDIKKSFDAASNGAATKQAAIIDFEKDPVTGTYRSKDVN